MDTSQFWIEERDLTSDSGFLIFGLKHCVVLIIILLFLVSFTIWFCKTKFQKKDIILKIIAVLLPLLEMLKIIMLLLCHRMDKGHLPLHLCSMAIFIYPLITFTHNKKLRESLSEISVITLMPAAVFALLFPDWTMYPIMNFYCIHAFLWHALQVLLPILFIKYGWCRPCVRNIWKNSLFLLVGGSIIWVFDSIMSCNYWFLKEPAPVSPLEWLYNTFGNYVYVPALFVMATLVNIISYGICSLSSSVETAYIGRKRKRCYNKINP